MSVLAVRIVYYSGTYQKFAGGGGGGKLKVGAEKTVTHQSEGSKTFQPSPYG